MNSNTLWENPMQAMIFPGGSGGLYGHADTLRNITSKGVCLGIMAVEGLWKYGEEVRVMMKDGGNVMKWSNTIIGVR